MTREESLSIMKVIIDMVEPQHDADRLEDAIGIAIKSLEQENALDKIRDEIESHCGLARENHCRYCSYCTNLMEIRNILELIDKCKAESEGVE